VKIKLKKIDIDKLITPANYGSKKGIDRKSVYYLMKIGKIDFIEIDSVKFILLNEKSKKFIK
jgi:hypothetical protein